MKYFFVFHKQTVCKYFSFLVVFLFACLTINAQAPTRIYKNGIMQGVVKIEFEESMTSTLSRMQIKTVGNQLSTGIQSLDKATKSINALHMERIIPECSNIALEEKHRRAGLHLWYFIQFDQSVSPLTAYNTLKNVAGIKSVSYEFEKVLPIGKITEHKKGPSTYSTLPFNDPYLKDQWHYINNDQLGLGGEKADINLGEAWKVTAGRSDVIISVHDQGVDVNHEDLKANMWINPNEIPDNGIDDDGNGYIDDVYGFNFVDLTGSITPMPHGTHVAGTIAAVNNNGIGVSGVAGGTGNGDGAKIMSLQILDGATSTFIMRSYVYAADMGAVISQNSWGYSTPGVYEKDVQVGIDYFIDSAGDYADSPMKGGIVIFAAGNDNDDDLYYPGYYEKCFTVAAVGPQKKKASYSNYGKWVELSAPGGDQDMYGLARAGILSTLPRNQYGYMDGTSMACPHVSGIAALVLSNSKSQMTNTELWNILEMSTRDIDIYNPNYTGKLGLGLIDAALAVKENKNATPDAVTTLKLKGIAQEFATLQWIVPKADNEASYKFNIYHSTDNITSVEKLEPSVLINKLNIGDTISFDLLNLKSTTKYYFGVMALDRWGNKSALSNIVEGTTNNGPAIDVNTGDANNLLNITANLPIAEATKSFNLLNKSEGLLRWNTSVKNTGYTVSTTAYSSTLPKIIAKPQGISKIAVNVIPVVKNEDSRSMGMNFVSQEIKYSDYARYYMGDSDPQTPTSGAVKYTVTGDEGFNLTQVDITAKYTLGTGPITVQVYEGGLKKSGLRSEALYTPQYAWQTSHKVNIEHVYFEKGAEFYIVVHIPADNGHSLAIGQITSPEYTNLCWYSPNYGENWYTFAQAGISDDFAWNITAISQYENIENLITLTPASGSLPGNSNATITAKTDAANLINGTYKANIVFDSNDPKNSELRIPVEVKVTGQKPELVYPKIVDFGSIFKNAEKTLDLLIENYGYGLIKSLVVTTDNPQFEVVQNPATIQARTSSNLRVKFKPTTSGNVNGKLTLTDGTNTYVISLFGVGAENAEMNINPLTNIIPNINIGDTVSSIFTIENTGKFPLKYFIPGFDNQNISKDWPTSYQHYGYVVRSNNSAIGSPGLVYAFNDISTTGVDITNDFVDSHYSTIKIPFDFPYYGQIEKEIYATKSGFTTFSTALFPYNRPDLGNGVPGYICMFGDYVDLNLGGKIHYKAESDKLTIQYTHLHYSKTVEYTMQMVLHANGDIRFYYEEIPTGNNVGDITILIEDVPQKDGILVKNPYSDTQITSGTVVGFDYPGPNIIQHIDNGSGILAPNETATVSVKMVTDSLSEGTTKRNINIVSNDPINATASHSAILQVVSGGIFGYDAPVDSVNLGLLYKDVAYTNQFRIKNTGTKLLTVSGITYNPSKLTVANVTMIEPGINQIFSFVPNTSTIGEINETIKVNFNNGTSTSIVITGDVRLVPDILANLAPLSANLQINDQTSTPYEIENTGGSDLDVSIIGGEWFNFVQSSALPVSKYDYYTKQENNGEPSYNWINIEKTGTKISSGVSFNAPKEEFWKQVKLPFKFSFYGVDYESVRIGDNGILAFGGDPETMQMPDNIPLKGTNSAFIFPMWSPGSFDTYTNPESAGLYVQNFDDKVVILWQYFVNYFGWGQSGEAILYKDGRIKIMYKRANYMSDGSGSVTVGYQNAGGEEYKIISKNTNFTYGKGLSFVISPDNKYSIPAGEKLNGNIILDSKNIYGGNFNDTLLIKTNVPDKTELKKPVAVNVQGAAAVDMPKNMHIGDTEVVYYDDSFSYKQITKVMTITNKGTAPFRITGAKIADGSQYLDYLILFPGLGTNVYIPVADIPYFPEELVLPGASFEALLSFTPESAGSYTDILTFYTSIGNLDVKLTGFAYNPPSINIDNSLINVSLKDFSEKEKREVSFDNMNGGYKLDYSVAVNYKRSDTIAKPLERVAKAIDKTHIDTYKVADINKRFASKPLANTDRIIKYFDEKAVNNAIGNRGSTATNVATRFAADSTGFNLSDIVTYVSLQKGNKGVFNVEVRVGGDDITTALSMAKKDVEFEYPSGDSLTVIKPITIALDEEIQILPNEDFYVIISYPYTIDYPQSIQMGGVEVVPNRFLLYTNDGWVDLQVAFASVEPNLGYAMYAVEHNFKESGWLKILSSSSGTLQIGDSSKVNLEFVASLAERGDQKADLVLKTSDENASIVKIPVNLHINEAPKFINAPSSLIISEKETANLEIVVRDIENDEFTIKAMEIPDFVTCVITDTNTVQLSINPNYGDEGNHKVILKATDSHNATNEYTLNIHVAKTNRAPEFIGNLLAFKFNSGSQLVKYDINDFFSDPDGDNFTFEISSSNTDIIDAYQSGDTYFVLEPKKAGEAKLKFIVTDEYGAALTIELEATVDGCIDAKSIVVQMWNNALVVSNTGGKYTAYQWYKNGAKINGATKQYYGEGDNELDVNDEYYVELTTKDGETLFTCPMHPVKQTISLMVYPNPVKLGESVSVVTQLPNMEEKPLTIQVVSIQGQLLKTLSTKQAINTIEMPYGLGVYFIKVTNGTLSKSFKVVVE